MTATTSSSASGDVAPEPEVTFTIDGVEVGVPKGTLVIRAAEQVGIQIPRFCDHPLLKPAGACRQCLVEVSAPDREGNLRPMPKPQTSCTLEATPGMVVSTQHSSPVADKAQHAQIEFLLVNHPLDCPVCDKGGECPLQNQAMSNGAPESRFLDIKRTFPKPIKISTEILLDRDRCILCQRCTRFQDEIAGDPFIELQGRGGGAPGMEVHSLHGQQIGTFDEAVLGFIPRGEDEAPDYADGTDLAGPGGAAGVRGGAVRSVGAAATDVSGRPFSSYFSGNTIQICPVGALTSATYRFRSRPFDLVSSPSIGEHDACGSAIRVDHRRGVVLRRLAGDDPVVNEEWITDKDRFAFTWQNAPDVLEAPMVRDEEAGELVATSWSEALAVAAEGLQRARSAGGVGVLPGGRLTLEDGYAWSKFARVVLGTNDVDFRARVHSDEEVQFLGHHVAGSEMDVTFSDLERVPRVLLVGLEPEDEAGTIFLRLRKGMLAGRVHVTTIAPLASRGTTKMRADLISTTPGGEAQVLDALAGSVGLDEAGSEIPADLAEALAEPGVVVLAGERLAASPGALSALLRYSRARQARLAWVPRRAGDRAAVEAGLLPTLLPGGRPVTDAEARVDLAALWGSDSLPQTLGRDHTQIVAAAGSGELGGLLVGGVDLSDLPDPAGSERAIRDAGFVVQLEVRHSLVTPHADVVLPVAPPTRKSGTFLTWEGRPRPFEEVFTSHDISDARALDLLARQFGVELGTGSVTEIHHELAELGGWSGARIPAPDTAADTTRVPGAGNEAVLATWRLMLDAARGQDGEPHLAGTAHRPVVRMSARTAEAAGVAGAGKVTVVGPKGSITLPLVITPMPDQVLWLPQHSPGSSVHRMLGVTAGQSVTVSAVTAEVRS
ncbi:NADH-quinone oxidoreductase subunit G [Pseudactinotalea sp. Z1732]|uniref:NADH-quinone oxidoreductase subunit G n=1 Tax=Pseudactinotalea sp. Z1732 TaxID=3413026 RepID=UPI003C799375